MTSYTFTTVNVPNSLAGTTRFFGINGNGEIVGAYLKSSPFGIPGFIYDNGSSTDFDDPAHQNEIVGGMINDADDVLGKYSGDGFTANYWFYNGSTYTDIGDPLARDTTAVGL